jgi:hypothetical protein
MPCANPETKVHQRVQQQTTKQDDACLVAIGQQMAPADQAITPSASGSRRICRNRPLNRKMRKQQHGDEVDAPGWP